MELSELTVASFVGLLGSDAPAPGGGSAAALAGALGAALAGMVSALTLGRKKYAEQQALAEEAYAAASELKEEFLAAMENDTAVFNDFGEAMALPRETPAQKARRTEAMQKALRRCTESPLQMMELAVQTLELTERLIGKTNASALSDLGVSALLLGAGLRGAWLNVLINLGSLRDEQLCAKYRRRAGDLLELGETRSMDIYRRVEEALKNN